MLRHTFLAAPLAAALLLLPSPSEACRVLELELTPTDGLQIAVWLEDSTGKFVDTLYITQGTGTYGLGNRPGIMEFNSEYKWPYGRRESVLPVWAHRRGQTYPKIVFQDVQDHDLSHGFIQSSDELFYCHPLLKADVTAAKKVVADTGTCASPTAGPWTDKGMFEHQSKPTDPDAGISYYPPRSDVKFTADRDHDDVKMYAMLNDLDAVSRATPPGQIPFTQTFTVPVTVPDGTYAVWVEVGKEFDQNQAYSYPSPVLSFGTQYGEAYRGQPSVLWKVPIVVDGGTAHAAVALDYVGYGDPDGLDGNMRPADSTITTSTEGSGAQRLLMASSADGMYRVRVSSQPSPDSTPPEAPTEMSVAATSSTDATITFVEPADPTSGGAVEGYDVRLSAGEPITAANFTSVGKSLTMKVVPVGPGNVETIDLGNLTPQTHYWVAIRAHDSCLNGSTPAIVELVTPKSEGGEVSACFIATAAFGSPMQPDVQMLRGFRDQILRRQAVGEMLVETYYTFGPALAGVIRPSETLRAVTRAALEPVIVRARPLVR